MTTHENFREDAADDENIPFMCLPAHVRALKTAKILAKFVAYWLAAGLAVLVLRAVGLVVFVLICILVTGVAMRMAEKSELERQKAEVTAAE